MKPIAIALMTALAVMLFSAPALADPPETAIYDLPTDGQVTIAGTVDQVATNDHRFVLRNDKGTINVSLPADKTMDFKVGDSVTVTGVVKKPLLGVLGSEVKASSVQLRKNS